MNLIKLSVGSESLDNLRQWQASGARRIDGFPAHVTRMWPKQADAILKSQGSIYWVIQGHIQARQRIAGFHELTGEDSIRRCAILLEPDLIPVTKTRKRPFQGWRYLKPADAPRDLPHSAKGEAPLPQELSEALNAIGVL